MLWNNRDWSSCPMYHKSRANGTTLEKLEESFNVLSEEVHKMELEQSITMQTQLQLKNDVAYLKEEFNSLGSLVKSHMEDEAEYHINNNNSFNEMSGAIMELTTTVQSVIGDNQQERVRREKAEELKAKQSDDWRKLWFRIGGSIALAIMIAIGAFLWGLVVDYNNKVHVQAVQEAILSNQEQLMSDDSIKIIKDYKGRRHGM